jgi:hypothetical protein
MAQYSVSHPQTRLRSERESRDENEGGKQMPNVTSMAVSIEDEVTRLKARDRLKWPDAVNHANYYHEGNRNGFYDGVAACLDVLADRYGFTAKEGADSAFFLREAAKELWSLQGEGRRWQTGPPLTIAQAVLHLLC